MMDVKQVIADLQKRHPGEPQFLQAATEVLESVAEIYNQNPKFEKKRIHVQGAVGRRQG